MKIVNTLYIVEQIEKLDEIPLNGQNTIVGLDLINLDFHLASRFFNKFQELPQQHVEDVAVQNQIISPLYGKFNLIN